MSKIMFRLTWTISSNTGKPKNFANSILPYFTASSNDPTYNTKRKYLKLSIDSPVVSTQLEIIFSLVSPFNHQLLVSLQGFTMDSNKHGIIFFIVPILCQMKIPSPSNNCQQ